MPTTSTYAAILSLLYVFLSVRVVGLRRAIGVGLTDGGNKLLLRRIRIHANFAEYVPVAVILMILAESQRGPAMMLHSFRDHAHRRAHCSCLRVKPRTRILPHVSRPIFIMEGQLKS
jgi:uncharacterized membrane protein YecN with MAPEG domain